MKKYSKYYKYNTYNTISLCIGFEPMTLRLTALRSTN